MMKTDILIVTALGLEFKAVEQLLVDPKSIKHPSTGTYYKRGVFTEGGSSFTVSIVESGAGNVSAARATESALAFFQPNYVFFVGVGGGIKDVGIGDVVASLEVVHYEGGKADDEYKPRLTTYSAAHELVELARLITRDKLWQHRIDDGIRVFKSEVKTIAAGEKVVASTRSEVYKLLKQSVSQALAVEMEGYGFLSPVHAHHAKGIVIRGISDLLKNKAKADAGGSQELAARNAAAYCAEMLAELLKHQFSQDMKADGIEVSRASDIRTDARDSKTLDNLEWRKQLTELLASLYEKGPTDNNVWKRAGGHVRFLTNSDSNETQWFVALDYMAKGGAGAVTLESLLATVRKDFGSNSKLIGLCDDIGLVYP